jgi:hypothetical protein
MANSRLLESHEFGRLPISNVMPFAESSPSEPQHLVLGALLLSPMTQMSLVEPFWGCIQQWGPSQLLKRNATREGVTENILHRDA